jgi:MFS family permease
MQKLVPFNKIIKTLIFSDILIFASWGLLAPILAIFVVENIEGGTVEVAGIAVGIYWITKSFLQVPIGRYLDRTHGERDDYWFMILGLAIASVAPLLFLLSSQPWHIYGLQVVHAAGMALAIPSWGGIFTRHIDRGLEAASWSTESSALGLGVGIAGITGGIVAEQLGFAPLFVGVSILGFLGAGTLLLIRNDLAPKRGPTIIYHKKTAHHGR